jgi:hypothetical protein
VRGCPASAFQITPVWLRQRSILMDLPSGHRHVHHRGNVFGLPRRVLDSGPRRSPQFHFQLRDPRNSSRTRGSCTFFGPPSNMERTQTQRRVVGDQRNERSNPLHRCARRLSSTYRYRIGRRWSGLIASLRINDIRRHRRHTDRATTRRRCTDTGLRIKKPAARRISKPKDSRPNY